MGKQDHGFQSSQSILSFGLISTGLSYLVSWIWQFTIALFPSFVVPQPKSNQKPKTRASTNISTLDGLRGISSFFVVQHHWIAILENSYLLSDVRYTNSHYFFHLPYIHLLWHGPAQVAIFFVLSGYVLSVKSFKQIHQQQWQSFHRTVSSSAFRRAIRIFLPPIASIVICSILVRLGAFDRGRGIFDTQYSPHSMRVEMRTVPPPYLPTFMGQVKHMLGAILDMLDPAFPVPLPGRWNQIDDHLWTIPNEYYCSMSLYLALLATSRLRGRWRILLHLLLVGFCGFAMHYVSSLFFAGMTIAELDLIWKRRHERRKAGWTSAITSTLEPKSSSRFSKWRLSWMRIPYLTIFRVLVLLGGLWVLSAPRSAAEVTPGYIIIFSLPPDYMPFTSKYDLIRSVGAILTVWSISNISTEPAPEDFTEQPWWSSFRGWIAAALSNPISQYLGRISFSLYLVHGPVITGLGYAAIPVIYQFAIPSEARRAVLEGPGSTEALTTKEIVVMYSLTYMIIAPVAIWVSDVFTRFVDEKCVSLGRKVEDCFSVPNEDTKVGSMHVHG